MSEPRRVEIKLGDLCNNRCAFCMSGDRRAARPPWAPLARVEEELRHYRGLGCGSVGFLGGEPTVYPEIVEAVSLARVLGYSRIALCSNGTRLADPAFCERLVGAGLTRVTVSLHSHRAELEDGVLTRVPGNHARKVAAVRLLLEWRRRGRLPDGVSLNPVLSRHNLAELPEYLAFAKGLGIADVRFNFIWPEHEARGKTEWVPRLREAAPAIVEALLLGSRRLGLRVSFGGVPACALRFAPVSPALRAELARRHLDESVLDADNDVAIPGPEGGPSDRFVWQERKKDRLKARGPACGECRHAATCEGVWGSYADLYGFDELLPC